MNDAELATLVVEVCGTSVFVVPPEPQILPDPALTPGSAAAEVDLDLWYQEGFAASAIAGMAVQLL